MRKSFQTFSVLLILFQLLTGQSSFAHSISEILQKIQESQGAIHTLQAEMTTTIQSSSPKMPKIEQKGKILTKTPDKSRVEITMPIRQITITNGNKIKIIDVASGKSSTQDLSQTSSTSLPHAGGAIDPSKALEQFDLKVIQEGNQEILLEGKPKQKEIELGKMLFALSSIHYLPTRIVLYDKSGKQTTESIIKYAKISGIYVPIENHARVILPQGSMKIDVKFENIVVNRAIPESAFETE